MANKQEITKYVAYGAGAVALPAIANSFGQVSSMLAKIPMWGTDFWSGITLGGIVLASAGVALVDMFFFNR